MSNVAPARAHPRRVAGSGSVLRQVAVAFAMACLVAALALQLDQLLDTPSHVPRMSFVNRTVYDVTIAATGGDRDGWVPVTTARRGASTTVEQVLDQGERWIFRFASQGEPVGEASVGRAELERAGWRFVIPARVGAQLQAAGAPPSP